MKAIELASPTSMSAAARAAEITAILAATIIRSQPFPNAARAAKQRETGLGFLPGRSVHATPYQPETL